MKRQSYGFRAHVHVSFVQSIIGLSLKVVSDVRERRLTTTPIPCSRFGGG